jgi:hypothetical protein
MEKENQILKKANKELIQKATEQAASLVESEWRRQQLSLSSLFSSGG